MREFALLTSRHLDSSAIGCGVDFHTRTTPNQTKRRRAKPRHAKPTRTPSIFGYRNCDFFFYGFHRFFKRKHQFWSVLGALVGWCLSTLEAWGATVGHSLSRATTFIIQHPVFNQYNAAYQCPKVGENEIKTLVYLFQKQNNPLMTN